jgi:hypothetical protein
VDWEYRVITHRTESDPEVGAIVMDKYRLKELNDFGAEGWELVSVVPVSREDVLFAVTYVFKRPLGRVR